MKLNTEEQILHQQFSQYGLSAREWTRKCLVLLPEINRRRIWKKKKFSSVYEYARKLAGLSRATVDEALWVVKKVENKPELIKIIEQKGLRRVRPVASILTEENASFWTEKAKIMSTSTLETYVKNYREEFMRMRKSEPENRWSQQKQALQKIELYLNPEQAHKIQQLSKRSDFNELLNKLIELADKKDNEERPAIVKTSSRYIPKTIKTYVRNKTSGHCAHPTCKRPATSVHHTQRFALEKVHDPLRLKPLCTAHERLAHLGLIENEEKQPENWKLRKEPDQNDYEFYVDRFVRVYRPT